MISLGITGSIGMGKSTVVAMLRDMGIPVHDADETVHSLLSTDTETVHAVAAEFPDALISDSDGSSAIDRSRLSRALADDQAISRLEAILHPLVFKSAETFKQQMKQDGHPIIAFDIPLLFETGAERRFDMTVCVSAPPSIQRERVMSRPHMSLSKFEQILARQMPDEKKRLRADHVLENDGDMDNLRAQVEELIQTIQNHRDIHYVS